MGDGFDWSNIEYFSKRNQLKEVASVDFQINSIAYKKKCINNLLQLIS